MSRIIQRATFVILVLADLALLAALRKDDRGLTVGLVGAVVVIIGMTARLFLRRRVDARSQEWFAALRPSVLGSVVVGATLVFMSMLWVWVAWSMR
jgi:hypothetical protein